MEKQQGFFSNHLRASLNRKEPYFRVPNALLSSEQEHFYIPKFISLGPYHHDNSKLHEVPVDIFHNYNLKGAPVEGVDEVSKMSTKEVYKIKFVDEHWPHIMRENDVEWNEMVGAIVEMGKEIKCFYNLSSIDDNYSQDFAALMLLDSLFLLCFLEFTDNDDGLRFRIKCDILKLENQIPLYVLCEIFKKLSVHKRVSENDITELLLKAYKELSPFDLCPQVDALHSKRHLLGCIHAIVSSFLQIGAPPRDSASRLLQGISSCLACVIEKMCGIFFCFKHPDDEVLPLKSYTAVQLAWAGIKFKSFSDMPHNIWFDKDSHTLYRPQMSVSSVQTEAFFGNLVVLLHERPEATSAPNGNQVEANTTFNRRPVTHFVQLTKCLVETSEDVKVLRKSRVINPNTMLNDDSTADIWKNMCQPYGQGQCQFPDELRSQVDAVLKENYYRAKLSIFCHECYEKYFSTAWSIIGLVGVILTLGLTAVQTYRTVWECSSTEKLYESI